MRKSHAVIIIIILIMNFFASNSSFSYLHELQLSTVIDEDALPFAPTEHRDIQFVNFIAENTPDDAIILSSNHDLASFSVNMRYLFPRSVIHFTSWDDCQSYPTNTTHVALSVFNNITVSDVCQEFISEIKIYTYQGFEEYIPGNSSYLLKINTGGN